MSLLASELRIGNLVRLNIDSDVDNVYRVTELNEYPKPETKAQFFGIELTEDWLLRMGFKKVKDFNASYHFEINDFWVYLISNGFEIELETLFERHNLCRQWKFCHQLQNLYFALTGLELEIKP